MGMVGEVFIPRNAYYPRTPDYTLCSGVHVCWSEHSDSSFVYGFMSLDYGFGTMTATTLDLCKHTIVELPHHCYELGRTAKLRHNFPKILYIYKLKSCWLEIKNGHHSCNFENRFLTSAPEPFGHLRWKLHFSNRMTCRSKVYKILPLRLPRLPPLLPYWKPIFGIPWTVGRFELKLINRYKRIGYSLDIMRKTACLVVNPIIVDCYASLFNCTTAVRASDSMTASS